MSKVNELVICRIDYYNEEKRCYNQEDFENTIKNAVMLLLDTNYTMNIRYDDKGLGVVVIEFNPADTSCGCRYPYWLLPEEWESVNWVE